MKIVDPHKNPSLSEDLTVILLRGNGTPRTFRLSLPALQKSLTVLGFFFAFAIAAAIFLLLLNLFRFTPDRVDTLPSPPAPAPAPAVVALPAPLPAPSLPAIAPEKKEGFWGRLTGKHPVSTPDSLKDDGELRKEVTGLREDMAKLGAEANGRKELAEGENPGLLQFFGPKNVLATGSLIQVKNVKIVHGNTKDIFVDFELHNVDPEQRQVRGYIVVLAKTASFLTSYPENVFSPAQNIVLDYTKGETFAVSRFRQARATFNGAPLEGKAARYQVMLFANDGKVIADLHVEESR